MGGFYSRVYVLEWIHMRCKSYLEALLEWVLAEEDVARLVSEKIGLSVRIWMRRADLDRASFQRRI